MVDLEQVAEKLERKLKNLFGHFAEFQYLIWKL